MISDVGAPNDFFLKPDSRPKASDRQTLTQADETASKMKSDSVMTASSKKPVGKNEFSRKLRDVASEDKKKKEEPTNDRFSPRSSTPSKEAPIQKRNPQSEEPRDLEMNSTKEDESSVPKDSLNSKLSAIKNEGRKPISSNEEDAESVDESAVREVKADPNLALLAVVASPQFDVKDLTPAELKEVKDVLRDQQAQMKQESVQKFMSQLQTQFGITPDKVVQAFAKMDDKTLSAPPSETVSKFVDNLNVKGGVRNQIATLYKQMLNETGEAALNEKLLGSDDDSKSVSLKVTDTTQAKLAQLNKSLDTLNDNFFRKGEFQPQSNQQIPSSIREQLKKLTQSNEDDEDSQDSLGAMLSQLGNKAGALAAATSGATAASATAADASAPTVAATPVATPMMDMSAFNKNQSFDQGESGGKESQQRGTKAYSVQSQAQNQTQVKNFSDVSKLKTETVRTQSAAGTVTNQTSALGGGGAATTAVTAGSTAAALNPGQMLATGPTKQESTENVQELIKQAQIIIKKGGGEMNVEMKPEGMGQVHLKVALENGQVNIQMMAQNDKVKKLLEDGIHELKSNLAAHKLQVESLKVGIASGALQDKKMDTHSDAQREAMRDAQRQMAGEFASDMRDQRQDRQSGFTDIPGWRAYRQDAKRVSVEAGPDQMNTANRRDENRRLSLVA